MPLSGKFILPVFFLIVFLGAMLLGPILYFGLGLVFPIPFHRAMDRALLLSALAALVLFRSRIPLGKLWPLNNDAWKQLLLGYAIAAVSIQAMIGFEYAGIGFASVHLTDSQKVGRLVLSLVAAILIPPLEETVFRGFLQRELIQSLGWRAGWIIAAFIFMLAHFIKIPAPASAPSSEIIPWWNGNGQVVHWWSGVDAIISAFQPVCTGAFLCGRGLNLFLIGLIFGGIFLRSGTLWLNAGLHGGWIFALLLFSGLTRPQEPPNISWLAGDLLSNPITSMVLIMLGFWLWRFYRNPSIMPETGENAPST